MIDVYIPAIDKKELTTRTLYSYINNAVLNKNTYTIIDNGSKESYKDNLAFIDARVIQNKENIGTYYSVLQALEDQGTEFENDIVLVTHNDVVVHGEWDGIVRHAFESDPKLAIAGFFGAKGIGERGGRIYPQSLMLGKEVGPTWKEHSDKLEQGSISAASVLDGLVLIFRRSIWKNLQKPTFLAPHHFYDKILPLIAILNGYHCATIGVPFDHGVSKGMSNTANSSTIYRDSGRKWLEEKNIAIVDNNVDLTLYKVNENIFLNKFSSILPVMVRDVSEDSIKYEYYFRSLF